jgi:hypothetical protein
MATYFPIYYKFFAIVLNFFVHFVNKVTFFVSNQNKKEDFSTPRMTYLKKEKMLTSLKRAFSVFAARPKNTIPHKKLRHLKNQYIELPEFVIAAMACYLLDRSGAYKQMNWRIGQH